MSPSPKYFSANSLQTVDLGTGAEFFYFVPEHLTYTYIGGTLSPAAQSSLCNLDPSLWVLGAFFCVLVCSSKESSQNLWSSVSLLSSPLQQWAKCSLWVAGIIYYKGSSMSICPQREAQLQGHVLPWCQTQRPSAVMQLYVCDCSSSGPLRPWSNAFCHPSHLQKPLLPLFSF